jgi:DnaJ-class molecular chaperone
MADYELARTFHPDAPAAQALPATVRHVRFHAVTRAYDILRGKPHSPFVADNDGTYAAELARRRRQQAQRQAYRRHAAPDFAASDEAWKDQVIIIVGLAVRTPSLHPVPCFHQDL